MTEGNIKRTSKFLSYILRHRPETIGLELDKHGWAHIDTLVEKANRDGQSLSSEKIRQVIDSGGKNRFTISEDKAYIRAGYGHSVDVDLSLAPVEPPENLYHGTAQNNLESIQKQGIHSGSRKYVHLSAKKEDAQTVGQRHGRPAVLSIEAGKMHRSGYPFYRSESEPDIWLVDRVPPQFISQSNR